MQDRTSSVAIDGSCRPSAGGVASSARFIARQLPAGSASKSAMFSTPRSGRTVRTAAPPPPETRRSVQTPSYHLLPPKGPPTPNRSRRVRRHPAFADRHAPALRGPLGLTIRPAARILRELPPSLAAYRVELSFRAATRGALTIERSPAGLETTKPLLLDPVETSRGAGRRVDEQGLLNVGFHANGRSLLQFRRPCKSRRPQRPAQQVRPDRTAGHLRDELRQHDAGHQGTEGQGREHQGVHRSARHV